MRNVLRHNGYNIALSQLSVQSSNKDISGVLVFIMPRASDTQGKLGFIDFVNFTNDTGEENDIRWLGAFKKARSNKLHGLNLFLTRLTAGRVDAT